MPGYKQHVAGGVVVWAVLLYMVRTFNPSVATIAEWLCFALAGSLFPDIDIKSKGQKVFYWALLVIFVVLIALGKTPLLIVLSIMSLVPMLVNHRGLFHRVWFVVGFPMLVAGGLCLVLPDCSRLIMFDALFFVVGALSHVWLDLGWKRMLRRW